MSMAELAREYIAWGLRPLPIPHRSKAPGFSRWRTFDARAVDVDRYFGGSGNIGVLNGNGIVDVDLDSSSAVELAPKYLPATMTFGRMSKPRSHWIYKVDVPTRQFRASDGKMLLEVRGNGTQSIWPGSMHPSGEWIDFDSDVRISTVEPAELMEVVTGLARACGWRERVAQAPVVRDSIEPPTNLLERARRYVATLDPAIEGRGGNLQTWRCIKALVVGFALPDDAAWELFCEFNERCIPPWDEAGLRQKFESAKRYTGARRGYLL